MKQYLELASQLEKMAEQDCMDVDKAASLWLLHSYVTNGENMIDSESVVKSAAELLKEEDLALHLGVEMALKSIMGGE